MKLFPFLYFSNNIVAIFDIVGVFSFDTTYLTTPWSVFCLWRQRVSVWTVGLDGIFSTYRSWCFEHVFCVGNKLKMYWVATRRIITNMMKDWNVASSTFRKRLYEPSIDQSMTKNHIPHKPYIAISESITSACPIPAPTRIVNFDLGKNAFYCFCGQSEWFRDILTCSHLMPPSQVSGLESERSTHRSDLSIISRGVQDD